MKLFFVALFLCSTQILAMDTQSASSAPIDISENEELLNSCFSCVDNFNSFEINEPSVIESYSNAELYLICLDQISCRLLQEKLEKNPEIIHRLFYYLIDYFDILMCDPFGNYLCQKMLELSNEFQRLTILHKISGSLFSMSINIHSTRAVQKLIEATKNSFEFSIILDEIKDHIVEMLRDKHGNYVVQKCLSKIIPNQNKQVIYETVAKNCVEVISNRYGCCVFQRCIESGTAKQKEQLIEAVIENVLTLINDPFANYVVQYILKLQRPNTPTELVKNLQGQIFNLAKQKHSSNVIEKCLTYGGPFCVKQIIIDLLFGADNIGSFNPTELQNKAQERLIDLSKDSFGNFVVQRCLLEGFKKADVAYMLMIQLLEPFKYDLNNNIYGKKVISSMALHAGINNKVKKYKKSFRTY